MNLLDLIFPKRCVSCGKLGNYLCSECTSRIEYLKTQICSVCYKEAIAGKTHPKCESRLGLDGVVSFYKYSGPTKEIIKALKYQMTTDILQEIYGKLRFDLKLLPDSSWLVLPLPLHKYRENSRGFNQAELLGKLVTQKLNLSLDKSFLKRKLVTKSQVGLSQGQRKANIAGAFAVVREVKGRSFYIFDDVWTSGATLKSVAKELKKAGAEKVWGLTFAHPR